MGTLILLILIFLSIPIAFWFGLLSYEYHKEKEDSNGMD